jgi:hypothetical protein
VTESETISWILLSIYLASQKEPANVAEVTQIADGINHAVTTQMELQYSINWLSSQNLITKGRKFLLSETGFLLIDKICSDSIYLADKWKLLSMKIQESVGTN